MSHSFVYWRRQNYDVSGVSRLRVLTETRFWYLWCLMALCIDGDKTVMSLISHGSVCRRKQDCNINNVARISIIIIIINPLSARVVGAPQMVFSTSFLHFPLFSTALWDLPNPRPVHSLMLSSHLFLCPPCLLPLFTVPCKMVLARPLVRAACGIYASTVTHSEGSMWHLCIHSWPLVRAARGIYASTMTYCEDGMWHSLLNMQWLYTYALFTVINSRQLLKTATWPKSPDCENIFRWWQNQLKLHI